MTCSPSLHLRTGRRGRPSLQHGTSGSRGTDTARCPDSAIFSFDHLCTIEQTQNGPCCNLARACRTEVASTLRHLASAAYYCSFAARLSRALHLGIRNSMGEELAVNRACSAGPSLVLLVTCVDRSARVRFCRRSINSASSLISSGLLALAPHWTSANFCIKSAKCSMTSSNADEADWMT
jgi:hypothetical protein